MRASHFDPRWGYIEDCEFVRLSSLDPTRGIELAMSYYSRRGRWRGAYQSPTREQHNRTVAS